MPVDQYQRYLNYSLRFLSYRARSEKEVMDYLQKKQAPQEIVGKILAFLKEKRFVNDEEFARWWIDQRLRSRPKSIRMLKLELKNKGISEEVAIQAISNFSHFAEASRDKQFPDEDGESNGVSDLETAMKLVEKKFARYKDLSRQEIYQKLGGFLARKGFDWETIKKSIDSEIERNG
jgi:regulatory protein